MSEKVICLRTPGSYEGILLECYADQADPASVTFSQSKILKLLQLQENMKNKEKWYLTGREMIYADVYLYVNM